MVFLELFKQSHMKKEFAYKLWSLFSTGTKYKFQASKININ